MRRAKRLAVALASFAALSALAAADCAADETTRSATAPARRIGAESVVLKPQRLEFNFGRGTASLSPKGEWTVEGRVNHNGLLCAEYSVGVRFGIGKPDCSNVTWLTKVTYVTSQRQCNNATLDHTGGDVQPRLADSFAQISCAERVVRCTGLCK
jgi:hypothetical protein